MALLALLGCAEPDPPAVCAQMCDAAEALYGACLTDWGADWSTAGYDDAEDFRTSCETWGWEMALLEQDADKDGWLEATCTTRRDAMAADDAPCSAYTDIDWGASPQ